MCKLNLNIYLFFTRFYKAIEPQRNIRGSQSSGARTTFFAKNPIITVTEHTPTPSPDYLKRQVINL